MGKSKIGGSDEDMPQVRGAGRSSPEVTDQCRCAPRVDSWGALALKEEKDILHQVTQQQRRELGDLERENETLCSSLAQVDLTRLGLECDRCSRRCATDLARAELEQFSAERKRLETELASWHAHAAGLRSAREAVSRREVERHRWSEERRSLEIQLSTELAQVSQLEAENIQPFSLGRYQPSAETLQRDLAQQQRLRSDVERQLRTSQSELAVLRSRRTSQHVVHERLDIEQRRVAEARLKLASEAEVRKAQAQTLQSAVARLENLRKELHDAAEEAVRLRGGLHSCMEGLDRIHRQSSACA